jgi:hypothetical protein
MQYHALCLYLGGYSGFCDSFNHLLQLEQSLTVYKKVILVIVDALGKTTEACILLNMFS